MKKHYYFNRSILAVLLVLSLLLPSLGGCQQSAAPSDTTAEQETDNTPPKAEQETDNISTRIVSYTEFVGSEYFDCAYYELSVGDKKTNYRTFVANEIESDTSTTDFYRVDLTNDGSEEVVVIHNFKHHDYMDIDDIHVFDAHTLEEYKVENMRETLLGHCEFSADEERFSYKVGSSSGTIPKHYFTTPKSDMFDTFCFGTICSYSIKEYADGNGIVFKTPLYVSQTEYYGVVEATLKYTADGFVYSHASLPNPEPTLSEAELAAAGFMWSGFVPDKAYPDELPEGYTASYLCPDTKWEMAHEDMLFVYNVKRDDKSYVYYAVPEEWHDFSPASRYTSNSYTYFNDDTCQILDVGITIGGFEQMPEGFVFDETYWDTQIIARFGEVDVTKYDIGIGGAPLLIEYFEKVEKGVTANGYEYVAYYYNDTLPPYIVFIKLEDNYVMSIHNTVFGDIDVNYEEASQKRLDASDKIFFILDTIRYMKNAPENP